MSFFLIVKEIESISLEALSFYLVNTRIKFVEGSKQMITNQVERKSSYLTSFLKEEYSGYVHSLFSHSINIQLGKQLIHVSDMVEPLSAFGLKIENDKMKNLLKTIKLNGFVSYQNNTLFFYNHLNKIISIINLESLIETDLTIKPLNSLPSVHLQDTFFFKEIDQLPLKMKTGLPLSTETLDYIHQLSNYSTESLSDSLVWNHFIGRGIGLTPSGDDFLIGYISILTLFDEQKNWIKVITPLIKKEKTTAISVAYLTCLMSGVVNENIKSLLDVIYSQDKKIVQEKLDHLLLFGHTSGIDTLYGMLTGVKAMIVRDEIK